MYSIRLKRVLAAIVDSFFVMVLTMFINLALIIVGVLKEITVGMEYNEFVSANWPYLIISLIIAVVYYSVLPMFNNGQTLGKMITKITVYNKDGSKVDNIKLFTRNLFIIFALVSILSFATSPRYFHLIKTSEPGALLDLISKPSTVELLNPVTSMFTLVQGVIYITTIVLIIVSFGFIGLNDKLVGTKVDLIASEKELIKNQMNQIEEDYYRPKLSDFGTNNPPSEEE